jgi:NADH-quinone oxidoreductase subunit N
VGAASLSLLAPELILLAAALALLAADLLGRVRERGAAAISLGGTVAAAAFVLAVLPASGEAVGGRFVVDGFAWWMKLLVLSGGVVSIAISHGDREVPAEGRGEYLLILLFTLVGGCLLASARDLVTLYVSLELAGMPLYLLAAWRRDDASSEAGLKYLVLGAMATSLLLFGMSLLYGLTGTTDLAAIGRALEAGPVTWLALALVAAGAGSKLSCAPFHLWTPDVYEGAPTPVTAYLSVVSKAVALGLLALLLTLVFGRLLDSLQGVVAALAAVTMTWGNVAAVIQRNVKRLLAYSGISQAGYLLLGLVGAGRENVPAMVYYMLVYLFSNLAVFAVLSACAHERRCDEVADFRGLSRTNPLLALCMLLALFSLAGVPPLSGFTGKFFLFSVAAQHGHHWLVALAAVNSTVSLYYYLRIVREMYIAPAGPEAAVAVRPALGVALGLCVATVLAFGIVPAVYDSVFALTSRWTEGFIR